MAASKSTGVVAPPIAHPVLIQGGMGAGVSGWQLASAVAREGQLGVVSGTALDAILARRLQFGDPGGHLRRAMRRFPYPEVVERVLRRYFVPGGKLPDVPFVSVPIHSLKSPKQLVELTVLSNFVEVDLAKEGHTGRIGINYLEKIQLPNLASLYGAMLAGVDYVLMGAGIPWEIPGALDKLAEREPAELQVHVAETGGEKAPRIRFDPTSLVPRLQGPLRRPFFLAIVASTTLARALSKRATGKVDGFVVEGPTAGGHNAPPRGPSHFDKRGQPVYGGKDRVNLQRFRDLGVPFWLAGGYGRPEGVAEARREGACGVQVGTPFAFCDESAIVPSLKAEVLEQIRAGYPPEVFTDPTASPTGFPFKVVVLPNTLANPVTYRRRPRQCDLGYLRTIFRQADGTLGYRCPAEPAKDYTDKGGQLDNTEGRRCLCNGLVANLGMGQIRKGGYEEPPILTSGDDLSVIEALLAGGTTSYSAADVIHLRCRTDLTGT